MSPAILSMDIISNASEDIDHVESIQYLLFGVRYTKLSPGCGVAGRAILNLGAPVRLLVSNDNFQSPPLGKEFVAQPRFSPWLAVDLGALDISLRVASVKANSLDCCLLASHGVGDAHLLKEGRVDEVNVLTSNGKQSHHGEEQERSHST